MGASLKELLYNSTHVSCFCSSYASLLLMVLCSWSFIPSGMSILTIFSWDFHPSWTSPTSIHPNNLQPSHASLSIQPYSQIMIGVLNHLSIIFRFYHHSQKVIVSLGLQILLKNLLSNVFHQKKSPKPVWFDYPPCLRMFPSWFTATFFLRRWKKTQTTTSIMRV